MGKLLFWAILILAALIVIRVVSTRKAAERSMSPPDADYGSGKRPETMVRCAHCGVHLPRSEALLLNGQLWCSEEHARLGAPS